MIESKDKKNRKFKYLDINTKSKIGKVGFFGTFVKGTENNC